MVVLVGVGLRVMNKRSCSSVSFFDGRLCPIRSASRM